MTPEEMRRAIAEQQTSDPEEIEALVKWMTEMIHDDDLLLPAPSFGEGMAGLPHQRWYTLDAEHNLVPVGDMMDWVNWCSEVGDEASRRVAYDEIADGVYVSTIFLGLDHRMSFKHQGPPIVFETLVSTDYLREETRYCTWDEALAGHQAIVAALRARLADA
jgi:hypothetical protein